MKSMCSIFVLILMMFPGFSCAWGADQATVQKGKALFNDPALGTNGKTCNTCHPDGRGLELSGERPDLVNVVNGCISVPLKGKTLESNSREMQSLVLYIKSLSVRQPAKKTTPAPGC